jgi:hypothetical protein
MAEDPRLVELLKFYREKATVTRPEVGILTGKSVGQIAGVCNRAGITGWPKINPESFADRRCQFPVLRNGQRHICGKMRPLNAETDSLCCTEHQGEVWDPDKEKDDVSAADNPALVELLKFYREKANITLQEAGILTGKTLEQIEEICRRHDLKPWPAIPPSIVRDRPCQFPILKHGERYVCGLMRPLNIDADPLCCSDHRGHVWVPDKE